MASIEQIYYENAITRLQLIIWQRFQNLKKYINTELRNILVAYPQKTEQVADKIDSLTSYIKNSNAITQSALIAEIAKNGQNVNAHAKLVITTAKNFSNSCQANRERDSQNESILLNHNPVLKLITIKSLRRKFPVIMQNPNTKTIRIDKT